MNKNQTFFHCVIIGVMVVFAVGCSVQPKDESLSINQGWKFKTGDDLSWASQDFDDSAWDTMPVDRIWEESGHDPYDGYAWYRLKFTLPASLKEESPLKDSLLLFLGKINNWDQAFLNGTIIGINNINQPADAVIDTSFLSAPIGYWDLERRYTLDVDDPRIQWDGENVLAIRVYDQGGQGGMYTGDQLVRMTRLTDYLKIDSNREPFSFHGDSLQKTIYLINRSVDYTLDGSFMITGINKLSGELVYEKKTDLHLQPEQEVEIPIGIPQLDQSVLFSYTAEPGNEIPLIVREESPYICTPKPPQTPRINGARVFGCRPGHPFLFAIPATGKQPIRFDAIGLPQGLVLDEEQGIITSEPGKKGEREKGKKGEREKGKKRRDTDVKPGEYLVTLIATNDLGSDTSELKIVIGDQIALTPPMGWNSWNCWGLSVTQDQVLATARAFRDQGLKDHGWTYVNIDDGWEIPRDEEPKRAKDGTILTNEKFPDMKALGDSIHAMGLKLGIYSSPGPLTCGGYTASYEHELQDAQTFADWGVDYLKYDWCSYGNIAKDTTLAERQKPYFVMQDALQKINRDIVYSICQYGMSHVWTWGEEVGGNLWRTTGDITDTWESLREIGFSQVENAPYAGPGHWNDPDMLIVGWVGWGPNLHPTRLTPDEQYTHISLWSLLSAPLLIGCDLDRLDEFTLNLLTNDEVLAINQDPLGSQATPEIMDGNIQVWVKQLADGNKAIGLFNLGDESEIYTIDFQQLDLSPDVVLRDLWRQKKVVPASGKRTFKIPSHGVIMVKTMNP